MKEKTATVNSVKKEMRLTVKARQAKALRLWQGLDDADKDRISFEGLLAYWADMSEFGIVDIASAMIYRDHVSRNKKTKAGKIKPGKDITPYHALCVVRRIRRVLGHAGIPQDQIADLMASSIGLCKQITRSVKRGYYTQPGRGISPDHALEVVEKLAGLEDLKRIRASKSYRYIGYYVHCKDKGITLPTSVKSTIGRMARSMGKSTKNFLEWYFWIADQYKAG